MSRVFKISLCVLLSVVGLTTASRANAQAKESFLFLKGVESYLLGDAKSANDLLTAVVKQNPIHAPSFYYLSRLAQAFDQTEMALGYAQKAVQIDSTNIIYLSVLCELLIDTKEYVKAEKLMGELREKDPSNQQFYILGAVLLLEIGKNDQALKLCEQFEQSFGLDRRMVDIQRMAYVSTESYYAAEDFMRRAVAAFPDQVDFVIAGAEINAALMRDSIALSFYDMAIALDSTAVEPHLAKAKFYSVSNKLTEYIEALLPAFASQKMAIERKIQIFEKDFFTPQPYRENFSMVRRLISTLLLSAPTDTRVRMLFCRYLTYSGQVEAAQSQYLAMIEQGIEDQELVERLLEIYFYNKEYHKAYELARLNFSKSYSIKMLQGKAIAAWLDGDDKLALKAVNEGLRRFKSDSLRSELYALQGDIYHKAGQSKPCYRAYKMALSCNDHNALVLNNYAYYLSLDNRDLDYALDMSIKASELSPDNPTYLDTQAWVLFCLGRYVDAQMLMRRVFALDGTPSAEILMHYGDILYALGDDFLARNYWRKALEAGGDVAPLEQRILRPKAVKSDD